MAVRLYLPEVRRQLGQYDFDAKVSHLPAFRLVNKCVRLTLGNKSDFCADTTSATVDPKLRLATTVNQLLTKTGEPSR